jgi:hypothetical protein
MTSVLNKPTLDLPNLLLGISSILQSVSIPYILFYLLIVIGLFLIARKNIDKSILFASCLGSSFLIATIGQLKPGAWLQYHFGFFMLATIPASISINMIFLGYQRKTIIGKALQLIIAVVIFLNVFSGIVVTAKIVANFRINYDFSTVQAYIETNYPKGLIYTPDDDLALFFHDRVAFAPWAELFLAMTPSMHSRIPAQKLLLSTQHFSVAVKGGKDCQNWKPSGDFVESVKHLNHFKKRFGSICIFD